MGKIADRIARRYDQASRDRQLYATKDDVKRLQRTLDQRLPKQQNTGVQAMGKAVRMMGRGIGNIGRSLNSPYDTRRPKISQLPARRRDIGISVAPNLDILKHKNFRGKDLRGRKIDGKGRH